ncbi:MAG: hypothetical protein LAT61_09845 [Alcanivorax sp.]|nr:hypothetical protein [Alcanivorax sp.]
MEESSKAGKLPSPSQNSGRSPLAQGDLRMSFDDMLGVAILWSAKAFLFCICFAALLGALIMLPATVFPNNAGWHDIDAMEILFYVMWVFLTFRYIRKVSLHKANRGRATHRYITAFGINAMVFICLFLIAVALAENPDMAQQEYLYSFKLVAELTWLAILFSIAPKGMLRHPSPPSSSQPISVENKAQKTENGETNG